MQLSISHGMALGIFVPWQSCIHKLTCNACSNPMPPLLPYPCTHTHTPPFFSHTIIQPHVSMPVLSQEYLNLIFRFLRVWVWINRFESFLLTQWLHQILYSANKSISHQKDSCPVYLESKGYSSRLLKKQKQTTNYAHQYNLT